MSDVKVDVARCVDLAVVASTPSLAQASVPISESSITLVQTLTNGSSNTMVNVHSKPVVTEVEKISTKARIALMEARVQETQEHALQANNVSLFCGACVNEDMVAVHGFIHGNATYTAIPEAMLRKHCTGIDAHSSPLYYAAGTENTKLVTALCDAYPFLIGLSNKYGATPLHWAAFNGRTEVVKILLSKGADLNAQSNFDDRPLTGACERGHDRIVDIFIAHGACLDYTDAEGKSPLYRACVKGHLRVVILLLQALKKNNKNEGTIVDAKLVAWAKAFQANPSNFSPFPTPGMGGHHEDVKTSIRLVLDSTR